MLGVTGQVLNAHMYYLLRHYAFLEELCNEANVAQGAHLSSPGHRLLLLLGDLLNCLHQHCQ